MLLCFLGGRVRSGSWVRLCLSSLAQAAKPLLVEQLRGARDLLATGRHDVFQPSMRRVVEQLEEPRRRSFSFFLPTGFVVS